MRQGAVELICLGLTFLALQAWWLSMTIKNGQNRRMTSTNKDSLAEKRKKLENLIKK